LILEAAGDLTVQWYAVGLIRVAHIERAIERDAAETQVVRQGVLELCVGGGGGDGETERRAERTFLIHIVLASE